MNQHTISYCRQCKTPNLICWNCGASSCSGISAITATGATCKVCDDLVRLSHSMDLTELFEDWLDINGADPKTNPYLIWRKMNDHGR